ncbi:MAG: hypothetical protein JWL60_2517 [Gemmatimonadetes bacterium]|jgi:tetratricopeptide (TPR) repeat protein|nr:hypothetical protein [Gemmatimonadota bacterium]
MSTRASLAALGLACLVGGCASAPTGSPDAIARLERQQRASPSSAPVHRALGIAYYRADRHADARAALETASRLDARDGTTALYLGLAAEALNDLPAAKRAYGSYLQFGRTSRVRSQLQSRLAALTRRELTTDARAALAQERTLGTDSAAARTVAVMPLRFSGADTALKPLERGFAELLITDLARSPQLVLVERSRMQALLDEMALATSGVTDASTSARAGHLLRAGRVVQGALLQLSSAAGTTMLRADAAVVDVPTARINGTAQGDDLLDQLFELEKKIAIELFQQLGVTLSPAERIAIDQRPTRSLAAFLAYSRGLAFDDAGRYDDAGRAYDEAFRLDPGFTRAQEKSAQVQSLSAGATPATVEASIRGGPEERIVSAAAEGRAPESATGTVTLGGIANGLNGSPAGAATGVAAAGGSPLPPGKDPVSAGTNTETGGTVGRVTFTFPRPRTP